MVSNLTKISGYMQDYQESKPGFKPDPTFDWNSDIVRFIAFYTVMDRGMRTVTYSGFKAKCSPDVKECTEAWMNQATDSLLAYTTYRFTMEKKAHDAETLQACINGSLAGEQCRSLLSAISSYGADYVKGLQ